MTDYRTIVTLVALVLAIGNVLQYSDYVALKRRLNTPRKIYVLPPGTLKLYTASYDHGHLFPKAGRTVEEAIGALVMSDLGDINFEVDLREAQPAIVQDAMKSIGG